MTETITLRIRPDWDFALTYDSLDDSADGANGTASPVFVGRQDLLDPLVAAIRQPAERGTHLISGYRGTGKTTLLIKALQKGREQLASKGWRLFPLILNVSEVSASLGSDDKSSDSALRIDPRRLLVALLRALQHRSVLLDREAEAPKRSSSDNGTPSDTQPVKFPDALKTLISDTYAKAMAAEYVRSRTVRNEGSRTVLSELAVDLKVANVYKLVGFISAVGASALGSVALLDSVLGGLFAAALGLAAVSVMSFVASRKVTTTTAQGWGEALSLKYDNSLQQLENDLKDILAHLYDNKLRTVVVLEELDKVQDEGGKQLDAVIRYFKNLFTQAPALFFFVTDKAYFDLISSRIKKARRHRSYSVEHTFFTHRVFVGRPTTQDCLDYMSQIVLDQNYKTSIADVYGASEVKWSSLQDMNMFARFVRVVLFRAANHLFDLKNEMRRFVRGADAAHGKEPAVELVIDERLLPEDQAALAVLQDRVEEKARSFALAGGRAYANEVLHDCLYAVFNELDSTRPQDLADFYPFPSVTRGEAEAPSPELLLDEQLELNEVQRIQEAVKSLVDDLHRGGAFETDKTDSTKRQFVWKPNAARVFRYVRKLERHEEDLVTSLRRVSAAAAAFKPQGTLGGLNINPDYAENLTQQLEQRANEIKTAYTSLPVEAALTEAAARRSDLMVLTSAAYQRQRDELQFRYGLNQLQQIAPSAEGGGLYLAPTVPGDPRLAASPGGAVLVAQGDGDRLDDDVREFVSSARSLSRLALVHVIHAPGDPSAIDSWRQRWQTEGKELGVEALSVDVLPLDEGHPVHGAAGEWSGVVGREIWFRLFWATQPLGLPTPGMSESSEISGLVGYKTDRTVSVQTDQGSRPQALSDALVEWLASSNRLLWFANEDPIPRMLPVLNLPPFDKIAVVGVPPVHLAPSQTLPQLFDKLLTDLWIAVGLMPTPPMMTFARDLLSEGTLISVTHLAGQDPSTLRDLYRVALEPRGRGIVVGLELPEVLKDLSFTKVEFLGG